MSGRSRGERVPPGGADRFVRDVLAETSGDPCRAAHERLHDFVNAALDAEDGELVAGHLQRCAPCRALTETLSWLPRAVGDVAEIDPPEGFTASVVARTRRARSPRLCLRSFRAAWRRQVRRPTFALEIGYAGAICAALLAGPPSAPLHDALPRAAQAAGTSPFVRLSRGVAEGVAWAEPVAAPLRHTAGVVSGSVGARAGAARAVLSEAAGHGRELGKSVVAGDIVQISVQLQKVGGDLERLLHTIVHGVTGFEEEEASGDATE